MGSYALRGIRLAGEPRRDLLDQPGIAIGILEGKERSVAGALGVGAALGTKLPE